MPVPLTLTLSQRERGQAPARCGSINYWKLCIFVWGKVTSPGRWLGHDRVAVEEVRADCQGWVAEHGWDGHALAVQDTTELNCQHHTGKVRCLGAVGNGKDLGLFLHPVLALDALQPELEGATERQRNPHPRHSLAWAS